MRATTVRLSLAVEKGEAVLRVDNDGAQISPADRVRVFERFVRLEGSRSRDAGGTGLGLAISREIVNAHGGAIDIVDEPNGWCRFEITTLPPRLSRSFRRRLRAARTQRPLSGDG